MNAVHLRRGRIGARVHGGRALRESPCRRGHCSTTCRRSPTSGMSRPCGSHGPRRRSILSTAFAPTILKPRERCWMTCVRSPTNGTSRPCGNNGPRRRPISWSTLAPAIRRPRGRCSTTCGRSPTSETNPPCGSHGPRRRPTPWLTLVPAIRRPRGRCSTTSIRSARDWLWAVGKLMSETRPLPADFDVSLDAAEARALDALPKLKALIDEACEQLAETSRGSVERRAARGARWLRL